MWSISKIQLSIHILNILSVSETLRSNQNQEYAQNLNVDTDLMSIKNSTVHLSFFQKPKRQPKLRIRIQYDIIPGLIVCL